MAQMMLYLDRAEQPADNRTVTFQIYDLDFDMLRSAVPITYGTSNERQHMIDNGGYLKEKNSNNPNPCYYTRFSASYSALNRCLSTNIPRQAWQEGAIPGYRISPMIGDDYSIYKLNPDYISFERVEGEQPPSDWEDNFWYWKVIIQSFTYQSVSYQYYAYDPHYPSAGGYDQSATIVKDKDHKLGAKYYTASGFSFGWWWHPYTSGARARFGGDSSNNQHISWRNPIGEYIRPGTDRVDPEWTSSNYISGISVFSRTSSSEKAAMLLGTPNDYYNFTPFFVSFDIDGMPFYGIAVTHTDTYGDQASPTSIEVIAFSPNFWGQSIIPGGDAGNWGQNSGVGGGDGTFTITRNDTRGDPDGHGVADRAAVIRSALDPFFTGANGFKLHQILSADVPDIYALLYSDSSGAFLRRYEQSMYNPLSAILSVHLLPQKLVHFRGTSSDLTISGYNVNANIPGSQPYPEIASTASYPDTDGSGYTQGLDSFDFDKYFGAFPDFAPYTKIRLHLPYCGVIDIDTNAVMHGTLHVSYICDAISGNVAAYVWCKDKDGTCTYKYVATGNAAYSIPMFAAQQDGSSVGKLALSLVGLGLGAATGNAAGVTGGIAGVAGAAFDAATAQRDTLITGQFSGNIGMLTDTVCWLDITRPQWINPEHYQLLHGETSQLSGTIDNYADDQPYKGYLQVQAIDTDGLTATDAEKAEIENLLRTGIFVNEI